MQFIDQQKYVNMKKILTIKTVFKNSKTRSQIQVLI